MASRILGRIWGIIQLILGIFFLIMGAVGFALVIEEFTNGEEDAIYTFFAFLMFFFAGIGLINGARNNFKKLNEAMDGAFRGTPNNYTTPYAGTPQAPYSPYSAGGQPVPGTGQPVPDNSPEYVVPLIPIPGQTTDSTRAAQGTPQAAPATPAAPAASGAQAGADDQDSLEAFVLRSDDLVASLNDLIRYDASGAQTSPDFHTCAGLLQMVGLPAWENPPQTSAIHLGRTNQYWLSMDADSLSPSDWNKLLSTEAALNVAQALGQQGVVFGTDYAQLKTLARESIFRFFTDKQDRWDPAGDIAIAYPSGTTPQDTPGEWVSRMGVSWYCENVPAPIRIAFEMSSSCEAGTMVIDLHIPQPEVFDFVSQQPGENARLARSWAYRLALAIADEALSAHHSITRVVVNARPFRDVTTCWFSMDLDRESLDRLSAFADNYKPESGSIPADPSMRARLDDDGWFEQTEAFMGIDDPSVDVEDNWIEAENLDRQAPADMQKVCNIGYVRELGINESAGRRAAWRRFKEDYPETTEDAVSRLMDIRDSFAGDLSVTEAAARTSQALIDGKIEVSDTDALRELFIDGSVLDKAVAGAEVLFEQDDIEEEGLLKTLASLESALAPIDQVGAYLDDSQNIYRYFGSGVERLRFNLTIDDKSRELVYVPDSYFRAHQLCARILNMLERYDEAAVHNDVLLRIAPASVDAILSNVRTLERESKIFEASEELSRGISLALSSRDAALCLYRLAYMEWKLGRADLSNACYTRALRWRTDISEQASHELGDLLRDEDLPRLTQEEAAAALTQANIPLGCEQDDLDTLLAAAIQCIDNRIFGVGRAYLGTLFEITRNDALINVYNSLSLKS